MWKRIFCVFSLLCCINNAFGSTSSTTSTSDSSSTTGAKDKVIQQQPLEFINAWARPPMNNNTAAYLVIKNNSNNDYVLTGVSAIETANSAEIHKSFVDPEGVSKMPLIDKLLIPAQSSVTMEPVGIHIMLIDLKYNLKVGAKFKLSFIFENAESKTIDVEVKDLNK